MTRALIPLGGLLLCGAAALPFAAQENLRLDRLPDAPPVVFQKLSAQPLTLGAAVQAAEERAGGRARRAELDPDTGLADVYVYTAETCHLVRVGPGGQIVEQLEQPEYTLPGAPVTGDPVRTQSGLMYYDLEVGDGPAPTHVVTRVQVHYTGWLVDGTKFDSSLDRGVPMVTPLNQVVRGWTEGVGTMRVGGKRKLIIPAPLAYGADGSGDSVPPDAMLVFDVELLGIVPD